MNTIANCFMIIEEICSFLGRKKGALSSAIYGFYDTSDGLSDLSHTVDKILKLIHHLLPIRPEFFY